MKTNTVKINENTLRQIIAESVKKVLNEMDDYEEYATQSILVDIDGEIEQMTPDEFYNFKKFVAIPQGIKYKVLKDEEREKFFR